MRRVLLALLGAILLAACSTQPVQGQGEFRADMVTQLPAVRHVFVINLENKGYVETFGPSSQAPYLAKTLRAKGVLLKQYYAIGHHSLPNYIAQISGQGPDPQTQGDCSYFSPFRRTGTQYPGQAVGSGCVYPASVRTLGAQLRANGFRWRAYMEDMGRACMHPRIGAKDTMRVAKVGDQYAVRHNPFVYFRSVIDHPAKCRSRDVSLSHLSTDLAKVSTTRNLSYITPNLCNDGHDQPCVDGRPGGLVSANAWLKKWVPKILASPAYRRNGLLVVTFDESEAGDTQACCGETAVNTSKPGITGPGGGRVGTVLISPYLKAGTVSTIPYNHYSLLRSIEDLFGLGHLGYAKTAPAFGSDVWG